MVRCGASRARRGHQARTNKAKNRKDEILGWMTDLRRHQRTGSNVVAGWSARKAGRLRTAQRKLANAEGSKRKPHERRFRIGLTCVSLRGRKHPPVQPTRTGRDARSADLRVVLDETNQKKERVLAKATDTSDRLRTLKRQRQTNTQACLVARAIRLTPHQQPATPGANGCSRPAQANRGRSRREQPVWQGQTSSKTARACRRVKQ